MWCADGLREAAASFTWCFSAYQQCTVCRSGTRTLLAASWTVLAHLRPAGAFRAAFARRLEPSRSMCAVQRVVPMSVACVSESSKQANRAETKKAPRTPFFVELQHIYTHNSDSMASYNTQKLSKEEHRAAKALDEARKSGTAMPAVDSKTGKSINPHIPGRCART